jgi:hypothetical protein
MRRYILHRVVESPPQALPEDELVVKVTGAKVVD